MSPDRRRPRRWSRGIPLIVVALVALPVSVAHLAGNTVPTSRAGQTTVPIEVTTRLVADGPDELGRLTAELSADGQPLAGMAVDFALATAPGTPECGDVLTDEAGVATCTPASAVHQGDGTGAGPTVTYLVTFAGAGGLAATSETLEVTLAATPAPDPEPAPDPAPDPAPEPDPDPGPTAPEPPTSEPPGSEAPAQLDGDSSELDGTDGTGPGRAPTSESEQP